MKENVLAKRYAKALHGMALERGTAEALAEPLNGLAEALLGDPMVRQIWMSPRLSDDKKVGILDQIAARLELPEELKSLLKVLARRRRVIYLDRIAKAYVLELERAGGQIRVDIRSAMELSDLSIASIQKSLQNWTGRQVKCNVRIDPTLIAGLCVRIGDKLIDHSVAGVLSRVH